MMHIQTSTEWPLPAAFNRAGSKDCTPILARVTPMSRNMRALASSNVPGSISIEICVCTVSMHACICVCRHENLHACTRVLGAWIYEYNVFEPPDPQSRCMWCCCMKASVRNSTVTTSGSKKLEISMTHMYIYGLAHIRKCICVYRHMITSAPGSILNRVCRASMMVVNCCGLNSDGVPPPKKTVCRGPCTCVPSCSCDFCMCIQ